MRGIKTVFKKEMRRVFYDPKMIFALFILPIIIMVGIYSVIGNSIQKFEQNIAEHRSVVYIRNMDESLKGDLKDFLDMSEVNGVNSDEHMEEIKTMIANGEVDLAVDFPTGFVGDISSYEMNRITPDVSVYYNPSEENSREAYERFTGIIEGGFKNRMLEERVGDMQSLEIFTINRDGQGVVINEEKASGKMLSRMLPYLITMLLFSSTMNLGADAFAGEKERGTMASLLLAPVKRSEIVLGKLLALTLISLLSAGAYIAALSYSLPKSMGGSSNGYTFGTDQLLMIAGIMLTLAFFYVALVSIISVMAKNVKEAGMYVTPIYIIVIVAGLLTMFSGDAAHKVYEYAVPVYGSALALGEVLTQELTMTNFTVVIISTIAMGLIASLLIAKLFNSEKVMFNA